MAAGPLLAAHRGGAALWPENSLLAFRRALALGSDLLELDVHLTADGEIVVIHDPVLDRTTDATGPVAARTAAELAQARLKGPDGVLTDERIPLLDDVLALVAPSRAALLVEIKGPQSGFGVHWTRAAGGAHPEPGPRYEGLEEKVLGRLGRAGLAERAIVMAFNTDVIARVRALAPSRRLTLLVAAHHVAEAGVRPEDTVEWAVRVGATDLGLQYALASAPLLRAARAAGLVLGVWTVNDEPAMRWLVELGVDLITSDRPDLLKRVLGRAT